MKKIFKNYKASILLLIGIILGGIVGAIFKEKVTVLKPLGDLYMNLMFVIIVPLIFLTITTSIAKINEPKRLGKVLITIFLTFLVTSLVAALVGLVTTSSIRLVNTNDSSKIIDVLGSNNIENDDVKISALSRTVEAISVSDFSLLLTKNNIIALVIFSILIGLAISKIKTEAEPVLNILESANKILFKFIDFTFYYAPIGLGCYFANLIGTFGSEIAFGYAKTFLVYTITAVVFYFVIYSLYAFISGGKKGFLKFWKNIIPPTIASVSTCSSAASIPVNIKSAKDIGVSDDIAETMIPLGTSFHKDGSVIGSVFKIMFLVYLFNIDAGIGKVMLVALVSTLLVTAIPVGGGTISETLIITMMGFPLTALPILTIIATIIDPAATLLNVVGDTSSSMLVSRLIDGKNWINKIKKRGN